MRAWAGLTVSAVLLAGCLAPASLEGTGPDAIRNAAPFRTPVELERDARDRNPTLALAPDGTWYVCTSMGVTAGSNLWRSLDGGASFEYLGVPLTPDSGPVLRSGTGDVGGGGCDVAVDAGGRVYLVDLWAGSSSVASSNDRGRTWRGTPFSQLHPNMDRPWALGGKADELFVTGAQMHKDPEHPTWKHTTPAGGIWVARSTDGGLTFPQQVMVVSNDHRIGLNGNLAWGGEDDLYLAYTLKVAEGRFALMVARSHDRGLAWTHHEVAEQDFYPGQCLSPLNIFPAVAADASGGVFVAWTLANPETGRIDIFYAGSPDRAEAWHAPLMLAQGPGTRVRPWLAATPGGGVGVVWYETNTTILNRHVDEPVDQAGLLLCEYAGDGAENAEWHLAYAYTANGAAARPDFSHARVHPGGVHRGVLDASFAEVIQVEFDRAGRAAVAYMADDADGAQKAYFALQEGDAPSGEDPPTFAVPPKGSRELGTRASPPSAR